MGNARLQRQCGCGHIASWTGNTLGSWNHLTLVLVRTIFGYAGNELRHAVSPVFIEVAAVELIPCGFFLKPMVGSQIHHHGIRIKLGSQCTGCPMRQRKDDHVMPVQYLRSGVFHHKVGKLRNMRHMLAKLVTNG